MTLRTLIRYRRHIVAVGMWHRRQLDVWFDVDGPGTEKENRYCQQWWGNVGGTICGKCLT
jgi:hypothetical protein